VERAVQVLDGRRDHGRRLAEPPHDGAPPDAVAFAQIGIVGLDGQIELEALRLCGLLAAGAVHLVDVTVTGARQGDRAEASLASSTRFIELASFGRTTPSA
jgi:hypothetical protein